MEQQLSPVAGRGIAFLLAARLFVWQDRSQLAIAAYLSLSPEGAQASSTV
jgi:hypothetical protein